MGMINGQVPGSNVIILVHYEILDGSKPVTTALAAALQRKNNVLKYLQ